MPILKADHTGLPTSVFKPDGKLSRPLSARQNFTSLSVVISFWRPSSFRLLFPDNHNPSLRLSSSWPCHFSFFNTTSQNSLSSFAFRRKLDTIGLARPVLKSLKRPCRIVFVSSV